MNSILSIHRSPDRCETGRGFSGTVLTDASSEIDSTRPFPLNPSQLRSSGVLERSDRKTDCFDGGPWALESTDTLAKGLDGVRNPEGMTRDWTVRFESVARLIRATFKAVCELKPRQIQGRTHGLSVDLGGYKALFRQDKGEAEAEKAGRSMRFRSGQRPVAMTKINWRMM